MPGTRLILTIGFALIPVVSSAFGQDRTPSQDKTFRGGLNQTKDADRPHPVRNDVAQPGEEIVTLRYFKIKKGSATC